MTLRRPSKVSSYSINCGSMPESTRYVTDVDDRGTMPGTVPSLIVEEDMCVILEAMQREVFLVVVVYNIIILLWIWLDVHD